jgi:hypothetical protein
MSSNTRGCHERIYGRANECSIHIDYFSYKFCLCAGLHRESAHAPPLHLLRSYQGFCHVYHLISLCTSVVSLSSSLYLVPYGAVSSVWLPHSFNTLSLLAQLALSPLRVSFFILAYPTSGRRNKHTRHVEFLGHHQNSDLHTEFAK